MTIIQLLEELAGWNEIRFVVRNQSAIAELCGKPIVRRSAEYLTVEITGGPDHLHVREAALSRAEIASGAQRNCFVKFFDSDGEPVFTCYVPRTNRAKDDFELARLEAFKALKARWAGMPSVTVVTEE